MRNKKIIRSLLLLGVSCSLLSCGSNQTDLGSIDPTLGETAYARDTGTLVDHIFEMEDANFTGNSQSGSSDFGHKCSAKSYFIDASLSNGVCIRNANSYASQNTFKWTFESDKAVTVDVVIRIAAKYNSKDTTWPESLLSAAYTIKNNDETIDITDVKIPASTSASKIQNNNYCNMGNCTIEMKIHKGINNIEFLPTKNATNVDYFNIKTSANITNYTKASWYNADDILEIVTTPTLTTEGSIKVKCGHTGCTYTEATFTLPNLQTQGVYIVSGNNYSITIANKVFTFTAN